MTGSRKLPPNPRRKPTEILPSAARKGGRESEIRKVPCFLENKAADPSARLPARSAGPAVLRTPAPGLGVFHTTHASSTHPKSPPHPPLQSKTGRHHGSKQQLPARLICLISFGAVGERNISSACVQSSPPRLSESAVSIFYRAHPCGGSGFRNRIWPSTRMEMEMKLST